MSQIQPRRTHPVARAIKKSFVSGFVVFSFAAYALHERFGTPAPSAATLPQVVPTQQVPATSGPVASRNTQPSPSAPPPPQPTASPAPLPTATPAAPAPTEQPAPPTTAPAQGQYADGEYTGPVTDAYYGNVQVKAIVQGGKLSDVQFVEYPNDRRTSVRINNVAMPYLISEAIQAQSAKVDTISGATLTSEAFAQSLQVALDSAKAHA